MIEAIHTAGWVITLIGVIMLVVGTVGLFSWNRRPADNPGLGILVFGAVIMLIGLAGAIF